MESSVKVEHLGQIGAEKAPPWSLVETRIGETIGFVPSLRCFPRSWSATPPAWSVASAEMRAVRVESDAFSGRFDARVHETQEENWLLQLLSPGFLTWLTDRPQQDFGFEIHEGVLRCLSPGHLQGEEAERLIAESDRVAERVRSEALESEGLGVRELGMGVPDRIERALAKVSFDSMPAGSLEASPPFRRFAARDPRVYLAALGGIVGVFGAGLGALFEFGVDAVEVIIEVIGWIGPKGTGVGLAIFTVIAWIASIPEALKIASRSYGRVAFVREYARARGLRMESPQSFHRRLMRVDLPAPAQFVARGALADRREGWLVLCRSGRGLFHSYYDAAVFAAPGLSATAKAPSATLTVTIDDDHLIVWRGVGADRTAADLDAFAVRAVEILAALESARPGSDGDALDVPEGKLEEAGA